MFMDNHTPAALERGNSATIEIISVGEALAAPQPNPRSPAFAIQEIFKIAQSNKCDDQILKNKEDFVTYFPRIKGNFYEGKMHWDTTRSCWMLGGGPTLDASLIQKDALRWYVNNWDFSRHTRDTAFEYPEDCEFGPAGEGIDELFYALMPLANELTRRIFLEKPTERLGYCDVFHSDDSENYDMEIGFFDDIRTHRIIFSEQPFWKLEGFTIPALLRKYHIISYRVHNISARRSYKTRQVTPPNSTTFF